MAKSKFEYVKKFETEDRCLPNCWIIVRLDGRGFHRFSQLHDFAKPNDERSLRLMTKCAQAVMVNFNEICLAYGQSDEYSFVFRKDTQIFNRRGLKLTTNVCSLFASSYTFHWKEYFSTTDLKYPPSFDGRIVLYPTNQNLRDYLSWRQADCHINNLYNTVFWTLVKSGKYTTAQAEERLSKTLSSDKNEILFKEFGINYNNEPELFRKGTVLFRKRTDDDANNKISVTNQTAKSRHTISYENVDIIGQEFWDTHPDILEPFTNS